MAERRGRARPKGQSGGGPAPPPLRGPEGRGGGAASARQPTQPRGTAAHIPRRRNPFPPSRDRGGTLRYAWLRAPPLPRTPKIKPEPPARRLTQKASYEGGVSEA